MSGLQKNLIIHWGMDYNHVMVKQNLNIYLNLITFYNNFPLHKKGFIVSYVPHPVPLLISYSSIIHFLQLMN